MKQKKFFETKTYFEVIAKIESHISESKAVDTYQIAREVRNVSSNTVLIYFSHYLKYIEAARTLRKSNVKFITGLSPVSFDDLEENMPVCVPIPGFYTPFKSVVTKINRDTRTFMVRKCNLEFSSETFIQKPN